MSSTVTSATARTVRAPESWGEVEDRAAQFDVQPIDILQADRHDAVNDAAELWAKQQVYVSRAKIYEKQVDIMEAARKALRGRLMRRIQKEKRDAGEKEIPVTVLETWASGDPEYLEYLVQFEAVTAEYRKFIDDSEPLFAELFRLQNVILSCTERVNRGQALLRYAASEPRG